jgi:hypothetical protein
MVQEYLQLRARLPPGRAESGPSLDLAAPAGLVDAMGRFTQSVGPLPG